MKDDNGGSDKQGKRKIQFSESKESNKRVQTGSRRESQREVAERRAAHFARADPVSQSNLTARALASGQRNPVSSTPTGSLRRALPGKEGDEGEDADAELEAWPGPFSTARSIMAKRDAAKKARELEIAARASRNESSVVTDTSLLDEYDRSLQELIWPPPMRMNDINRDRSIYKGHVPTLVAMCAGILASNFERLGEAEVAFLQIAEREQLAIELAKLRKCDAAAALKLAVEGSQYLVLPECSEVDEEVLVRAMERAAGVIASRHLEPAVEEEETTGKKGKSKAPVAKTKVVTGLVSPQGGGEEAESGLTVLRLRNCGRGMTDRTAAVCINLAQGGLELLQLTGCYRLNDAALGGLLTSCCASLVALDLTCNSRLGGQALSCIRTLKNLRELTLDNCTQLIDDDLLKLLPDMSTGGSSSSSSANPLSCPPLLALSLNGLIEVTDRSIVSLIQRYGFELQTLSLSGCSLLTDETVLSVRKCCANLRTLGLGQLGEVSTTALLGLFVVHPALQAESTAAMLLATSDAPAEEDGEACAASRIGHLEEVCLQGTVGVTDDVIVQLCESNKRTLTVLDVGGCHQLTSRAAMALKINCSHSLRTLDLSFVRGCSQEAVGVLVDAGIATAALQKLTVWGCSQLSDKFFQGLRQDGNVEVVGRMVA